MMFILVDLSHCQCACWAVRHQSCSVCFVSAGGAATQTVCPAESLLWDQPDRREDTSWGVLVFTVAPQWLQAEITPLNLWICDWSSAGSWTPGGSVLSEELVVRVRQGLGELGSRPENIHRRNRNQQQFHICLIVSGIFQGKRPKIHWPQLLRDEDVMLLLVCGGEHMKYSGFITSTKIKQLVDWSWK